MAFDGKETINCSTKEFYHEAGYNKSRFKIKKWMKNAEEEKQLMNTLPTAKTADMAKLKKHALHYLKHLDRLLEFHRTKSFRSLRTTRLIFKDKKISKLCRKLCPKG